MDFGQRVLQLLKRPFTCGGAKESKSTVVIRRQEGAVVGGPLYKRGGVVALGNEKLRVFTQR